MNKTNLALNNLQRLICYKTETNQTNLFLTLCQGAQIFVLLIDISKKHIFTFLIPNFYLRRLLAKFNNVYLFVQYVNVISCHINVLSAINFFFVEGKGLYHETEKNNFF